MGSGVSGCFGTKLPPHIISISGTDLFHSLSCLDSEVVSLSSKSLHAAFYSGERLLAHHSILLTGSKPCLRGLMEGVPLKTIAIFGQPFRAPLERKTHSIQVYEALNYEDDVRTDGNSLNKPKGTLVYSLPHVRDFFSIRRDNERRARMVKPIEPEQGILIA
jgi:hypothetical protein